MGMESRHYQMRLPTGGNWITPGVKQLFIVITGVFLVQTLALVMNPGWYQWINYQFGVVPTSVAFQGKIWQPLSYIFLHGGLWHWLVNMFMLYMFACDVERVWGTRRFLRYFFITGAGAGVCLVLVKVMGTLGGVYRSDIPTIGASGAIYGVLMASAILFPDRQIILFPFPVTIPMRPFVFLMGLLAFFGTLGQGGDGISNIAHLSGLVIGWVYLRRGTYFFNVRNWYLDWQRSRMKRKFEVYMRKQQDEPPSRPDNWVN
jgi:membrane associated rhomboid family serine protease